MQKHLWQQILTHVSQSIDAHRFETWFRPLRLAENSDSTLLKIFAPNQFICDFLSQHYSSAILSAAKQFAPEIVKVSFTIETDSAEIPLEPFTSVLHPQQTPIPEPSSSFPSKDQNSTKLILNERYTFDSFVVGAGNEFARSAAMAVAEAPGKTKFNPLLLYGGVGLGKTHLLQSIGNTVKKANPQAKITYITSEEFYLNFIDAIKNNNTKVFTERFRLSDLLLVDDIQFLSGKESTQEEFFFIFNALHQNGRQIVLTSDQPPSSLKGLQDRLISRFQWGLSVDVQPPNLETRVAILKKKAEEGNLSIPQNVLYFIAEHISSNVRQLEGVVLRLLAYSSIMKNDITIELVQEVLKNGLKKEKNRFSIDDIIEKVAEYYNIPVNNIREKNRRKEVAHARQVAMYIAKNTTNYSLKTIGLNFGGRDHSTVIHAISEIENDKTNDYSLTRDIETILQILQGS